MPSVTEKQRRYLYMKFGEAWVKKHHFNKLKRAKRKKKY